LLFIFPVYAATVRLAKVYTCVTVVVVPVAAAVVVELADEATGAAVVVNPVCAVTPVVSFEVSKANVVAVPEAAFAARPLVTVTVAVLLLSRSPTEPAVPVRVTVNILPVESDALVQVTALAYLFAVVAHATVGVAEAVKMAVDAVMVTLSVLPTHLVCGTNVTVRLVGVLVADKGVTTPLVK